MVFRIAVFLKFPQNASVGDSLRINFSKNKIICKILVSSTYIVDIKG